MFYFCMLLFCFPFHSFLHSVNMETIDNYLTVRTNNWAILVSSSRFWFNYRHISNTLSVYKTLKRLGIPDSHIILMLSDDIACNSRNPYAPYIFDQVNKANNLYTHNVEIDYKGYEVTVENFFRVLTGRQNKIVPHSKSLLSNKHSNILVYISGHGGEGFVKFQDSQELLNKEIANTFSHMWAMERYKEILLLIDTCQASSMFQTLFNPNILAAGSSDLGEDSLSHQLDTSIGLHLIDKWTYYLVKYLDKIMPLSNDTLLSLFNSFQRKLLKSTPSFSKHLYPYDLNSTYLSDFFGSIRIVYFRSYYSVKSLLLFKTSLNINIILKEFSNYSLPQEFLYSPLFLQHNSFFHSFFGLLILMTIFILTI